MDQEAKKEVREENPKQVDFFFEHDPSYRIAPVNGVWGGLTPRVDSIRVDFFLESLALPSQITQRVEEGGALSEEIKRDPPKKIVRHVQFGAIMSPEVAESIAEWLKGKVEEYRRLERGSQ